MTNETDYIPCRYNGNGITKDFSFNWKADKATDLIVKLIDSENTEETLTLDVDYTVLINENTGNIKLINAPQTGETIVIERNTPQYQSSKYSTSPGFQGSELERSFDKVSLNLQEMQHNIDTFKTDFSNEINQEISDFEEEINQKITDLSDDVAEQIEALETETNEQISDFKDEVNTKIQEVSDAAEKINGLEEAVEDAQQSALQAQNKAAEAATQAGLAQQAAQAAEEAADEAEEILESKADISFSNINDAAKQVIRETAGSDYQLFDLIAKDHVLSFAESKGLAPLGSYVYKDAVSGSRYGYPDFYTECISEKEAGTETQTTLGDSTITTYNNANGHIFYDIADKSVVDAFYESLGVAWFYGIDTTNERIFLPRGKNYLAFTQNNIPVVGNGLSLGLMDGKGNNAGLAQVYVGGNMTEPISAAYGVEAGTDPGTGIAFSPNVAYGVTDDAEKSGLVANAEDLFSNNPEAYIYMVVGNTEVESAATDITDITTTENDTIPLFAPWYFDFEPNSVAWLKAGQQANSGGVYTTAYNTLVDELTTPTLGLKVIDVDDMESDVDYSLYWKVDQTAQTFTTPTRVSYAALSGKVMGNGMTVGLFNGSDNFGLSNSTYTTRLYPSSNTYGTDVGTSPSGSEGNMVSFGITTDPDKSGIEVEKVTSQLYFKVSNAVQNLQVINVGEITAALADKIGKTDCPAYITETYLNGTSWYRLYSDGWCEQGGRLTTGTGSVTLIKEFENTDYYVSIEQLIDATGAQYLNASKVRVLSTDSFTYYINANNGFWEAKGYISQGE